MQESVNKLSMLKVGTILRGVYRIDSYLSSGGFGNTYVATNIEFEERVAVKEFFMKGVTERDDTTGVVSVSNADKVQQFEEQREKFKKEAQRIRKLDNQHIVKVHDLFEENGTAYYVMDFVEGEDLSKRLKRTGKPMAERKVREILLQLLDALKTVHDAGMWHLDIKPANIILDKNGNVKLIDFGASKQFNAQKGGATSSTAICYTNGYAPREQMEQSYDKFGPWTDFYALGATLYNLLTNKRPPMPSDIDDDMSKDKHLALPMPASVSENIRKFVIWLMQTNRLKRPQSVNDIFDITMPKNFDTVYSYSDSADDEETILAVSQSLSNGNETNNANNNSNNSTDCNKKTPLIAKLFFILLLLLFSALLWELCDGFSYYIKKDGLIKTVLHLFFLIGLICYGSFIVIKKRPNFILAICLFGLVLVLFGAFNIYLGIANDIWIPITIPPLLMTIYFWKSKDMAKVYPCKSRTISIIDIVLNCLFIYFYLPYIF